MSSRHKPRILVTRSPHQASALADSLRALGTDPILIPTIDTVDPTTFAPLDTALVHLDTFHWLLFTSANAVEAFHRRTVLSGPWALDPGPCRIAVIGPATAQALQAIGLKPNLIPPQAIAESFADALLPHARQPDGTPTRFLLIRAEEAREHLPRTLRAAGADVSIAPAYRTVIPAGSVDAIRKLFASPESYPDAITFTSSSTARNLFALLEAAGITLPTHSQPVILSEGAGHHPAPQPKDQPPSPHPQNIPDRSSNEPFQKPVIASIGPITSATLHDLGYPPHVEATEASVSSLAENLVKYLSLWKTSQATHSREEPRQK